MAKQEIHLDDSGVEFKIQILDQDGKKFSLEDATVIKFRFQKPDQSDILRDGTISGNSIDGVISYLTTSGDLDQVGMWKYQVYIEKGSSKLSSDITKFRVHPNI